MTPRGPSGSPRVPGSLLLLPGVAALVLAADQASKWWVQQHFPPCDYAPSQVLVPHWLALVYTCNAGAAFGLLANARLLFVLVALVVASVIVAYIRFLPSNRPWLKVSLGLQLGGAVGNMIDRLHQGYVVDFIAVRTFPVFNLADSCIVVGVTILGYYLLVSPGGTTLAGSGASPLAPPRGHDRSVAPASPSRHPGPGASDAPGN